MSEKKQSRTAKGYLRTAIGAFAGVVVVTLLGFWFMGRSAAKIPPGSQARNSHPRVDGSWVPVRYMTFPRYLTAVGTVTPIAPVNLAARISGRIVQVQLFPGEKVHMGQVLVRLDATRLRTEMAASAALVAMAKAQLKQALIDQRRDRILLHTGDVTVATMDVADTAVNTDRASLANALAREQTAKTILRHATIISPINGVVMRKFVSTGDTIMPGEILAELYDPSQMQLNATVRQSLAGHLRLGEALPIKLAGLHTWIEGTVRQIIPHVSTQTRSFTVKISAKFPAGVWPGMFGGARVPLPGTRTLVIPAAAIEHIGQLDVVHRLAASGVCIATIQPGLRRGAWREVLSGLSVGQKVLLPASRYHSLRG
jgi:RND family efflux transporter MFP subunit